MLVQPVPTTKISTFRKLLSMHPYIFNVLALDREPQRNIRPGAAMACRTDSISSIAGRWPAIMIFMWSIRKLIESHFSTYIQRTIRRTHKAPRYRAVYNPNILPAASREPRRERFDITRGKSATKTHNRFPWGMFNQAVCSKH